MFSAQVNATATNSAQLAQGRQFLSQHQSEQAATLFHRMLEADPNDGLVWSLYGNALDEGNQSKGAISAFTQAIRLGQKSWDVYHARAMAYSHIGNFPSAITDFNVAIKTGMPGTIDYGKADVYTDRADAEMGLQQFGPAISDYTSALKYQPSTPKTPDRLVRRAHCYAGLGKQKEAIDDMTKCLRYRIKQNDHIAAAYLYRAQLYTQAKNYDKAIADLTATLKADPSRSAVLRDRAKVYDMMGRKDLATKDRQAALKADSEQF